MRSRVVHWATRLVPILAIVLALVRTGPVVAATPTDQNSANPPTQETEARRKAIEAHRKALIEERKARAEAETRTEARPAERRGEPEPHKPAVRASRVPEKPAAVPSVAAGAAGTAPPSGTPLKGHAATPVPPAPAPPSPPEAEAAEPAPKIPRFEALKTDDTNMRKGPGQRYPIEWVYQRRDLPMEIEREYDVWRYVRDPDGLEGWVHEVTLADRRTFMVTNKDAILRSDAKDTASAVAVLKVGVIGRLRECDAGSQWCQVQAGGYKGYLRRDQVWGLLPDEVLAPS